MGKTVTPVAPRSPVVAPILGDAPAPSVDTDCFERLLSARRAVGGAPRHAWRAAVDARDVTRPLVHSGRAINRAFFKAVELLYDAEVRVVHRAVLLCEAPGGFTQVVARRWPEATVRAFSLETPGAIAFASDILHLTERGLDGEGDVTRPEGRASIIARVGTPVDLVMADGANATASDDLAEEANVPLLLGELAIALSILSPGGTLIVKVFECLTRATLDTLALLRTCFAAVSLRKPASSRATNSERYIVCREFDRERGVVLGTRLDEVARQLLARPGASVHSLASTRPSREDVTVATVLCAMQIGAIYDTIVSIKAREPPRVETDIQIAALRAKTDAFFQRG